jgi:hypothetical protein
LKIFTAKRVIALFWLGSVIALGVLSLQEEPAAWDAHVYWTAIKAVHRGGDPYAEGIAAQTSFHNLPYKDPHIHPPMTYVYSPITLPVLRVLGKIPGTLLGTGYFLALLGCFALQLWAGWQMARKEERRWLPFLLPAVCFFPGLLNEDVILSGNVAYVLHGLVLAAAVPGWRRNRWGWFYAAVLAASICKAPLLTLLAFPVILGRRQWLPTAAVGTAGLALFAAQIKLWPVLFAEYLTAVRLQFDWNKDFGFGPGGLLGESLVEAGLPYQVPTELLYLGFALVIALTLLWISRRIRANANEETRESWVPVVAVGTVLLNPRIKEYDVAAITIPMILIGARFIGYLRDLAAGTQRAGMEDDRRVASALETHRADAGVHFKRSDLPIALGAGGWFLTANFATSGGDWKPTELALLIALFAAGTWTLMAYRRKTAIAFEARELPLREFERQLGVTTHSVDAGLP